LATRSVFSKPKTPALKVLGMRHKIKVPEIGEKFGKLNVAGLPFCGQTPKGVKVKLLPCTCDCDPTTTHNIYLVNINRGTAKSCGCMKSSGLVRYKTSQGLKSGAYHPLKSIHRGMLNRCSNSRYKNYVGRGIYACDEWLGDEGFWSFAAWAEKTGWYEGCGLWLERIDNDGPYSPDNCTWKTHKEQQRNKQDTIRVEYEDRLYTIGELIESFPGPGIKYSTVYGRLKQGYSVAEALNRPNRARKD